MSKDLDVSIEELHELANIVDGPRKDIVVDKIHEPGGDIQALLVATLILAVNSLSKRLYELEVNS